MTELTKEAFNKIFTALLTETKELAHYDFVELPNGIIRVSNGTYSTEVILDGFYRSFLSGDHSLDGTVAIAAENIVNDFKQRQKEDDAKKKDHELDVELNSILEKIFGISLKDLEDISATDTTTDSKKDDSDNFDESPKNSSETPSYDFSNIENMLSSIEDVFCNTEEEKAEVLSSVTGFLVHNKQEPFYKENNYAYSKVMGMLFVYHIGEYTGNVMDGYISNDTLKRLKINLTELHSAAFKNMVKNMPLAKFKAAGNGYVVTNGNAKYGAAAILYPDVLKEIAEENNSDLIVVPLSEDGFYVIPNKGDTEWVLKKIQTLMDKNRENIVSDDVLRYSHLNDNVYI